MEDFPAVAAAFQAAAAAVDFRGVFMNKKSIITLTVIAVILAVIGYALGYFLELEQLYRSLIMAPAAILIVIAFFFSTKVK